MLINDLQIIESTTYYVQYCRFLGYCYHSVIVIKVDQCDGIERQSLYFTIKKLILIY